MEKKLRAKILPNILRHGTSNQRSDNFSKIYFKNFILLFKLFI
jgi:hypothetical protein